MPRIDADVVSSIHSDEVNFKNVNSKVILKYWYSHIAELMLICYTYFLGSNPSLVVKDLESLTYRTHR